MLTSITAPAASGDDLAACKRRGSMGGPMVEQPDDDKQVSISSTETLSAGPSLRRLRRGAQSGAASGAQYGTAAHG